MGDLETVPRAADRLQVARIFGIGFDFFPNASHIDVDRPWCDVSRIPPDRIEELIAREDATCVTHEVIKQTEFSRGGRHLLAANGQSHSGRIDVNVFNLSG